MLVGLRVPRAQRIAYLHEGRTERCNNSRSIFCAWGEAGCSLSLVVLARPPVALWLVEKDVDIRDFSLTATSLRCSNDRSIERLIARLLAVR